MTDTHQQTIATEFAKQAVDFGQPGLTLSSEELLNWAVDNLPHDPETSALDIATGTGHLSRALAPHVGRIIGIDATPAMLAQAITAVADATNGDAGLTNIDFVRGLAEHLPFPNDTFDLTVCRLAIHHYQEPARQVAEMARVCKPGSTVAIVDLTAPDEEALVEPYNHYERLRDPSHTVALSVDGLVALLTDCGINVTHVERRQVAVKIEAWLALTRTPDATAATIRRALQSELDGGPQTGMKPFVEDDALTFRQTWAVVSGQK